MLTIHRARRLDTLAEIAGDTLAVPPADPMTREIIAVPTRGVGRWLSQRLAARFGVAANIAFPTPERLLDEIAAAVDPALADSAPWARTELLWHVLAVLDDEIAAPEIAVLAAHVGAGAGDRARRGRRLAAAATLTRLFVAYGRRRPAMIAEWAAGADTDGAGNALPDSMRWQPWFWRRVRERIATPHLAERLGDLAAQVRERPCEVDLPGRLAVFGATALPAGLLPLLAALGADREVGVYLPYPADEVVRDRPTHPLLASCAREVRALEADLAGLGGTQVFHPGAPRVSTTLLGRLQEAVAADSAPASGGEADGSIEIHSCHGPSRQVEVLHDRLLALFADDPTLAPRDVVVLCPDLATFGPLIRGEFGMDGGRLRVRLADRGIRETNPVLDVLATLLELAADRVRSGELLDLAASEPVRQRFGFSDDDLDTLADWIHRAGIRWGIDDTQRGRLGLTGFPQGTAETGLDRIALGVAAEESDLAWLATALPLSGVESTKAGLAGRFAEFVELLGDQLTRMGAEHTAEQWSALLLESIELLTETTWDTQWQQAQVQRLVTGAFAQRDDGEGPVLLLTDVRELVTGLLSDRPSRSDYCTGELIVCPMAPLHGVPHRVIVLLGMDDSVYPRAATADGDDILALAARPGESTARDGERQIFLDAVTAATEKVLVFYTGTDPVTAGTLPPATVVSELADCAGADVRTRHTLHAFDAANFTAPPFSFDDTLLGGARGLLACSRGDVPGTVPPLVAGTTLREPGEVRDIALDDLIAFFQGPAEALAVSRLGLALPEPEEGSPDQLAVTLAGLEKWKVGDRCLTALLHGVDLDVARGAEQRRGTLPPFQLGGAAWQEIAGKAQSIAVAAAQFRAGSPRDADIAITLPDGRRLTGTVGDLFGIGDLSGIGGAGGFGIGGSGIGGSGIGGTGTGPDRFRHVTVTYSGLGDKHRIAAWIRLLALAAAGRTQVAEAVVVGGGRSPGTAQRSRLAAPENAGTLLNALVAVRDAGMRRPLGLTLEAGVAAAREFSRSGHAQRALERASRRYGQSFVDRSRYLAFVFTGDPTEVPGFDALRSAMPAAAELPGGGGWLPGDDATPMYIRIAAAAYGPMLGHEDA